MSSSLTRVVATVLLAATAQLARAQDIRELTRNLDAAVALRDSAAKAVAEYERARTSGRTYTDTIALLGHTVQFLANRDVAPLVRAAAAQADSFAMRRIGATASIVPPATFAVRVDTTSPRRSWLVVTRLAAGREGNRQLVARGIAPLTETVESLLQQLMLSARPPIGEWLGAPLPLDTTMDEKWRAIRLQVAASPTTIARHCFEGDIAACKAFLGLTSEADPAIAWYDSTARRIIVESKKAALDGVASSRCIDGSDADCIALMRSSAALAPWLSAPAFSNSRSALVAEALAAGGAGSLAAFLAHDSVATALSAAAQLPVDSVVARWQRHMHDAGIKSDAFNSGIALFSVGWIVVMGGLSTRSSRWR